MSLLKTIQEASVAARVAKDSARAELLVTLYSEAARVGKDKGNRESLDDEVIAVVRKFLNGVDESLKVITDATRRERLLFERSILVGYLPSMLTESQLRETIAQIVKELGVQGPKAMGAVMSSLKARHAGAYEGDVASRLVREALAQA